MKRLYAAVLLPVALTACGGRDAEKPKDPGNDELTIVVQADRSRIASEEAALEAQRKSLEGERELLRAELEKLTASQGGTLGESRALLERVVKLVKQQEELANRRSELSREKDGLLQKVFPEAGGAAAAAPAGEGAPAADLGRERVAAEREKSLADRERDLAEREKAMAQREAALAQREASCAVPARREPAELSKAGVERAYKALLAAMEAKGVLPGDLPPARQEQLQEAARRGPADLQKAMNAVEAVQAAVEALAVDGDFVSQKVKRVNALQARKAPDAKAKEEVGKLLQQVTRAYSDGRFPEANRLLNDIVSLLQKQGGR